ncbi:hypothetical protein CYMTET_50643 [Cymbomonas tetramitiformis]|uniref:Methyltransferase domain-containing protein n=1 Tax=Cymbomonas tetramitiformis TaxID=36881 RepID=A0AAE0BPE0_9CHLO|nr:hypothetical protein CYMTET_50643 [Cymbomonas tetramitiformis]|eukprot:gene7284-8673_t
MISQVSGTLLSKQLARTIAIRARTTRTYCQISTGGVDQKEAWRDPHSISSSLDVQSSQAIIKRLESRGTDPIFTSLFDTYFPYVIENCDKALEIGAGTGVVCRALAESGFEGTVLGLDQSEQFIQAARDYASHLPNVNFSVVDARNLKTGVKSFGSDFDCLLMHTLISHVEDPLAVLREAREVVEQGADLIIVEGDYTGLSYHSATKPGLSESLSRALVTATFAQPGVVRDLPALLRQSGWSLNRASGKCVSEIGDEFSYWKSFAQAYMPRVSGSGMISQEQVDEWWADQLEHVKQKQFFASCTYYTYFATAV